MKSLLSWLITMFIALFWMFRIVVTLSVQYGAESFGGFIVIENTFEIAMLFITLLCIVLIVKRKALGGIIYLVGYGLYFGGYVVNTVLPVFSKGETVEFEMLINVLVGLLAVILGFVAAADVVFERSRAKHYSDDKTDWYFKTDKYDRKYDERADKNQYRTL